ncbi:hypothetical protein ES705_28471 [subsurface metagenome]
MIERLGETCQRLKGLAESVKGTGRLGDGETEFRIDRETGRDLPGYEIPGRVCEGDREAGRQNFGLIERLGENCQGLENLAESVKEWRLRLRAKEQNEVSKTKLRFVIMFIED